MNKNIKKAGFSLIEVSIVVLIVSVMASSSLKLLGKKNNASDKAKTSKKLQFVSRALQVYYDEHNKLPCPARYDLKVTNANFGSVATTNNSAPCSISNVSEISIYRGNENRANIMIGAIPFVTLGIPPRYMFDEWGRKITYMVDGDAVLDNVTDSVFHIEVRDVSGGIANNAEAHSLWRSPKTSEIDSAVEDCRDESGNTSISVDNYGVQIPICPVFALISHGPNGHRAVKPNNGNFVNAAIHGPFEKENSIKPTPGGLPDDVIINMPANDNYDDTTQETGGYFDDIIVYREFERLENESQVNEEHTPSWNNHDGNQQIGPGGS